MLESLLYFFMTTPFSLFIDNFDNMSQANKVIKSYSNNSELNHNILFQFKGHRSKLGLKNSGFFCWLNASLKLLFDMTDYNDILLSYKEVNQNPNQSLNLIRNIFIGMWKLYKNYDNDNVRSAEEALEDLKRKLIKELHNFVNQNREETYGLQEYFGTYNANTRQDSNLFIIAMINILKLDSPRHKLQTCTYIEGIYPGSSIISRKVADDCPLIIYISEDDHDESLNDHLIRKFNKIQGNYYWNANELFEQGVNISSNSGIMLSGNKVESIEANLNFINNFIIYINLNYTDSSFFGKIRDNIINLIFTRNFPTSVITVKDSGDLYRQKQVNIVVTTIICFKGSQNSGHYICISLTDDIAIVHDDEKVTPISDYLHSSNTDNNYLGLKKFLNMFNYTPCTILYKIQ